jgi:STE24 endopeptidase
MVLVAEGAVWLLRPDEPPIDPVPAAESDYFSQEQLERGRDYRDGQRLLFLAGLGIQAALLATLAVGRSASARRVLERLGARPALGGAAAGACLSLAITIATLPTRLWAHERAVDVGLSTQSLDAWFADVGRSAAIGAAFAAAGAALLLWLIRRLPRGWWIPGAAAVVAIAIVFMWLQPVVLAPIFNRFEALPADSELRAEVLELGDRAGVDIGEVYRVDASRRSTSISAYVGGVGSTKRVVLYDNLIDEAEPAELRSVVAHELGHVAHNDIPNGLMFVAIVAPLGLLFSRELGDGLAARAGAAPGTPASLPAYALAITLAIFVLNIPGNQLSRQVEASADTFALELTDDPQALIDLQRRLAAANVSDPDPPAVTQFLFRTHPPTIERIGAALAYRNESTVR